MRSYASLRDAISEVETAWGHVKGYLKQLKFPTCSTAYVPSPDQLISSNFAPPEYEFNPGINAFASTSTRYPCFLPVELRALGIEGVYEPRDPQPTGIERDETPVSNTDLSIQETGSDCERDLGDLVWYNFEDVSNTCASTEDAAFDLAAECLSRKKCIDENRVKRCDIRCYDFQKMPRKSDKIEDFCFVLLLQLLGWSYLEIVSLFMGLGEASRKLQHCQRLRKNDPYLELIVKGGEELERLGENLFLGSLGGHHFMEDCPLKICPISTSAKAKAEGERTKEKSDKVIDTATHLSLVVTGFALPENVHESLINDLETTAFNVTTETDGHAEKDLTAEECEVNQEKGLEDSPLKWEDPGHTDESDFHEKSPKSEDADGEIILQSPEYDANGPPKASKKKRKSKQQGVLLSTLMKGNAPTKGKDSSRLSSTQSIRTYQRQKLASLAGDHRTWNGKTTRATGSGGKRLTSKSKKRRKIRRTQHCKTKSKNDPRSSFAFERSLVSTSTARKSSIQTEHERILVVNYRKNGLRLVTFLDSNGFQEHLLLFISSDVKEECFDFRQFAARREDYFKMPDAADSIDSPTSLPEFTDCSVWAPQEPLVQEPDDSELIQNETMACLDPSGFHESGLEYQDTNDRQPLVILEKMETKLVTESCFECLEASLLKTALPNVQRFQDNENFACRENEDIEPQEFDLRVAILEYHYTKLASAEPEVSPESPPQVPKTPSVSASPIKSILASPKRQLQRKSLRVSFDFSQPDPFGIEANSYPVIPLYSSPDLHLSGAEERLGRLFLSDQNGAVVDDVPISGELLVCEAGRLLRDMIGNSQRVFECPGSSYFSDTFW